MVASDQSRLEAIKRIGELRGSTVITYIVSDGQAQMSDDAVRPMYDHLHTLKARNDKIDLYIYSRGGAVDVPWRIVTMVREFCDGFSVLIPYRANSAATLLSLGASKIIMGPKAELGPIDPQITKTTSDGITQLSSEDLMSYVHFVTDETGLRDQDAVSKLIGDLANSIGPLLVGQTYRIKSHVNLLAGKLLRLHMTDDRVISNIVETLVEKTHLHGHAIGRKEARDLGLPVEEASQEIEGAMWDLFKEYEALLGLSRRIYPEDVLGDKDEAEKSMVIAAIESERGSTQCNSTLVAKRVRQMPTNLNVSISVPPGMVDALEPSKKQLLDSFFQQLSQAVRNEVLRQMPSIDVKVRYTKYGWQDIKPWE